MILVIFFSGITYACGTIGSSMDGQAERRCCHGNWLVSAAGGE